MDQLEWCKKQKNGITIIEPNQNMAEDYFIKAVRPAGIKS
jgi:hypothetical protein